MGEKESEVKELECMFKNETAEPIQISYSTIKSITKNFCQVIGYGGFGVVYLGALGNDVLIAVKELCLSQDFSDTQFLGEIKCLKKVKHKNVVRFLGYCAYTDGVVMKVDGEDRLVDERKRFLCFEYAPNGNLHDYIQEKTYGCGWSIKYKIFRGICQGLQYLHQQRITHLDLKPENVLLGAQMEPKITDFGLSKCNDGTQSTIFTNNVKGTRGYIPPELIDEGKISFKSDIYSLGIIMQRLLTGSNMDIPENWHESLNVDCQQMEKCIEIARICADNDPYKRPTIAEIICKLTETEITVQNIPPVITTEPRNDPTSTLCKNVERFLALQPEARDYHRGVKKLQVECPKWKLAFLSQPKLPIYSGEKIEDANGNPLEVILMDAKTGEPSALPKVLQIELVPLLGNFPRDRWDADDFQRGVVKNLEGNSLVAGEHRLIMWDGRATLNEFMFTDDSPKCGCMFRVGVRVLPGSYQGPRILEALTSAFMIKDPHGDEFYYNKHYKWQLAFHSPLRLPIYLGSKIRDVLGNPLEIILVDMETGSPSVLPMDMDIRLVSLIGASLPLNWTVMDPRLVKGELSGDVRLTMRDGCVTVNELQFTDNLQLLHEFRIGVCVVSGGYNSHGRILEGMTKAFKINDVPTEMPKKHHPPALGDEVWRLEGISWGGVFHNRLTQNNIKNVRDFLRMLAVKPDELSAIIGDGMERTWQQVTRHARDCVIPVDRVYIYSTAHGTIYVNSILDLIKVEFGGVECLPQQVNGDQKRLVQQVMREAYEHQHTIQEVKLKLAFKRKLHLPIHTGSRIQDAMGNPMEIILVDAETASPLALPMKLDIKLAPMLGNFPLLDDLSLLQGDTYFTMNDGRVTVRSPFWFTGDSPLVYRHKFRISAHVMSGSFRIAEAMTEAFEVEPANLDPVSRLEMINKGEEFDNWLMQNSVRNVQDFLRMLAVMPDELRRMMSNGMEDDARWEVFTHHVRSCVLPGNMVYSYSTAHATIYMNSIFDLVKVEFGGVECPPQQVNDDQKRLVQQVMREAYEHQHTIQEVKLKLAFKRKLHLPIHAGSRIQDVMGNSMEIILVDAETASPLALPMKLDIKLVPMAEDLSGEGLELDILELRHGIVSLLQGDTYFTMNDGRVTVRSPFWFTGDSPLVYSHKFRIRAHVMSGPFGIAEAMTEAFEVEPANLDDPVSRLEMIHKGEEFDNWLMQNSVRNVQDFLRMLAVMPDELRRMMSDGMEDDATWEVFTRHVRSCVLPGNMVYSYRTAHATIYVNSIFDLVKVEFGGVECPRQQLDDGQKRLVQEAMREAFEHRYSLEEVKLTLKLVFKSQPQLPIHAGSRIEDATGSPLEVILVDAKTGSPLVFPTELKIELVPLLGDFPPYEDWSGDEFQKAIVKPRQQNVPLLKEGPFFCNNRLTDGRFTADELLQFTDDSSWVPCRKFRIGACVKPSNRYTGSDRILEAMTEAIEVGDFNRKKYPPVLGDPVWRLEMINKDGPAHRKLTSINVNTVQEFKTMENIKPDELRAIVGKDMTGEMLEMTIDHARKCAPGDKVYAYSGANGTIYVDSIFGQLLKIEIDGVECPLGQALDMAKTMLARQLILEAYEHRHNLQQVDDADMKLHREYTEDIYWLLRCAERYERQEQVKLDSQAQPLVDKDEDPVPQAAN